MDLGFFGIWRITLGSLRSRYQDGNSGKTQLDTRRFIEGVPVEGSGEGGGSFPPVVQVWHPWKKRDKEGLGPKDLRRQHSSEKAREASPNLHCPLIKGFCCGRGAVCPLCERGGGCKLGLPVTFAPVQFSRGSLSSSLASWRPWASPSSPCSQAVFLWRPQREAQAGPQHPLLSPRPFETKGGCAQLLSLSLYFGSSICLKAKSSARHGAPWTSFSYFWFIDSLKANIFLLLRLSLFCWCLAIL